jgi:hypothetical protein
VHSWSLKRDANITFTQGSNWIIADPRLYDVQTG